MGKIADKAHTTESLQAGLDASTDVMYPCLKCGKATKEHHGEGQRICSNRACRSTYHRSELSAKAVEPDSPRYPCSACGKETKEHHAGGRICSSPVCRKTFS